MAKPKITVTVEPEVLEQARAEVAAGRAESISAYVSGATAQRADRERRARAIEGAWGPFTEEELGFAAALLDGEQRADPDRGPLRPEHHAAS